ncbi:MAG: ATP synthase F1 subunit gamma [Eubacteriales bacterium]|nr:ATP synthase F1 subunit gamma [bacterium]MDY2791838.1 ATP synthase F1 subunit gamma [Eubacteriales bacterium]
MAGSTMKDIKLRIRSVESTKQITNAMQLVASSKIRKARQRMEQTRPYMRISQQVIADIASHNLDEQPPFFCEQAGEEKCVVVIAGDRGLAGHYNAAVFKLADELIDEKTWVLPVGKKALDRYTHRGCRLLSDKYARTEQVKGTECREMADLLIERFLSGQCAKVTLVSTTLLSALVQDAVVTTLLPVTPDSDAKHASQMIMEPDPATILAAVMPDYLAGQLYAAVCDAFASEVSARRNAMDSATKNAQKMIDELSLHYNRARQSSITQEITEIVAGAEE